MIDEKNMGLIKSENDQRQILILSILSHLSSNQIKSIVQARVTKIEPMNLLTWE